MEIPLVDILVAVTITLYAMRLVYMGWMMIKYKKPALFLAQRINLFFVGLLQGSSLAEKKKAQLNSPEMIRRSGIYSLIGGMLMIPAGLILLVDSFLRIRVIK